jgi:hypothetical protein
MNLPTELRRTYHLADVDPSHPIRRAADELERLGAERDALRAERDALKAARIAYASEFPPNADGEPDVGNIHANIRLLKKQCAERDGLLREALDRENRYVMPLYRDINYAARLRRALDIDPNDYYKIEDTGS